MAVHIKATGHYLPPLTISNDDLSDLVATDDEWITSRTGIKRRHIAVEDTTTTMGVKAAAQALAKSGLAPEDIDLVICATVTPDTCVPMVAANIKRGVGIEQAATFDLNANCSSCIYAMTTAYALMETCGYRHALVVASDTNSQIVDWSDRATCVLFGDGAGAVILEAGGEPGILATYLDCIIDADDTLMCANPLDVTPWNKQGRSLTESKVQMQGGNVLKFAKKAFAQAMQAVCDKADVNPEDIDCIIAHQANLRILMSAAKSSNMPMDKFFVCLDETANTSAASVPIALDRAVTEGRVKRGDLVMFIGFGGGLSSAAMLMRY